MSKVLVLGREGNTGVNIRIAEATGAREVRVAAYGKAFAVDNFDAVILVYPADLENDMTVVAGAREIAPVIVVERPSDQMADWYLSAAVEEVVFDNELQTLPRAVARAQARRRVVSQIERAARIDPLTELLNRRGIDELLPRVAARGEGAVAVLVDLDDFKAVNTRLGHAGGDAVLRRTAEVLRASTRPTDIVGRHGGDEFIVVMPGLELEAAVPLADRIRRALHGAGIAASLGIADASGARNVDSLVVSTQHCLAEGKRVGKNVCVYQNRAGEVVIHGVAGH